MKTLVLILQLLPALVAAIKSLSDMWPQDGVGKDKIALLEKIMTTSCKEISEIWPIIEKIVGLFVATDKEIADKTAGPKVL